MTSSLDLEAVIGFGGKVRDGLVYHPNGRFVLYPLGMTLVVKRLSDEHQEFLDGHTNTISCVALSKNGKLAASGQMTHSGFQAEVILWDLDIAFAGDDDGSDGEVGQRAKIHKLMMHRVKVVDVAFNCDDTYLASLGGDEDSNRIVVWDVKSGEPKRETSTKGATTIEFYKDSPDVFVAVGKTKDAYAMYNIHGTEAGGLSKTDMRMQGLRRKVMCIQVDSEDKFLFCGTTSGDILVIFLKSLMLAHIKTVKQFSGQGVSCLTYCKDPTDGKEYLLAGTGSGNLGLLNISQEDGTLTLERMTTLAGAVTSISNGYDHKDGMDTFVGTNRGNQYIMNSRSLEWRLRLTAHYEPVRDICFPAETSELFVTCSKNDIRVWLASKKQELLRIQVPNLVCNCVCIPPGGSIIISGWDDGKIRAFTPESGKLAYTIPNAHQNGVTAINCMKEEGSSSFISGGADGRVRLWQELPKDPWATGGSTTIPKMVKSVKEHSKTVASVNVSSGDDQAITASQDGSVIVWTLPDLTRVLSVQNTTMFAAVMYHPDSSQFLTCGSDRKITYWTADGGRAIRVLDGSEREINTLDIQQQETENGEMFVTGGNDRLVRVWDYDEGSLLKVGSGHSASINRIKISPDGKKIVSVGSEGGIFIWNVYSNVL